MDRAGWGNGQVVLFSFSTLWNGLRHSRFRPGDMISDDPDGPETVGIAVIYL